MTLVCEDELIWTEIGGDQRHVLLAVLLVSLKSGTCDLL